MEEKLIDKELIKRVKRLEEDILKKNETIEKLKDSKKHVLVVPSSKMEAHLIKFFQNKPE